MVVATGTMTHRVFARPATRLGHLAVWMFVVAITTVGLGLAAYVTEPWGLPENPFKTLFILGILLAQAGPVSFVLAWVAILRNGERSIFDFVPALFPFILLLTYVALLLPFVLSHA